MWHKAILSLFICCCVCRLGIAQSIDEIRQKTDEYMYGEGWGETLKIADNAALASLISKISVTVRNDFTSVEIEKTEGRNFVSETSYNSIIKTYSQSTLTNTERIILKNEPEAHVFRYIKKSEINRIFEGRKNKIYELISIAETADGKNLVSDALRYYYWAYVLLSSMRYPNELSYEDVTGNKQLLVTWLPFKIESILNNISVDYKSRNKTDENVVELKFNYKGEPIRSLEFTYFDGVDWSNIYGAKDGVGIIELRPHSPEKIQLKYEYEYYGESMVDSEVHEVLNSVQGKIFKKAYTLIDVKKDVATALSDSISVSEINFSNNILQEDTIKVVHGVQGVIDKIVDAITTKQYENIESCFTEEGYQIFEKLLKYGKAYLVDKSNVVFTSIGNESYCRNLIMSFTFGARKQKFIENVTFTFDKDMKISNVTFGLDQQAVSDIMGKEAWDNMSKVQLINFLENYRTAYALKRIDYISNIFSDDALIVTGRVVKRMVMENEKVLGENRYVEFIRQNKQDYIKRLAHVFSQNEYVNVKFANTDLTKMGRSGELYGIQLRQDYYSTYYGDSGYLFLMVDLNNPEKPIIHVRTWQPERDPNFGVIGPGHF